jgi:hypothetical protein
MQEGELKAALAKELRRDDIERLWSHLRERDYVQDVLIGAMGIKELAAEAREILAIGRPSGRVKAPTVAAAGPAPGEARSWALSMLVAAQAEQDDLVLRFRKDTLGGATLTKDEAANWIKNHVESSQPVTRDLTVIVEADDVVFDGAWVRFKAAPSRLRFAGVAVRILDYADADGEWVQRVAVRAGGQLDSLRGLADALAKQYCWQMAQAVTFVLTGAVPLISRIRKTTQTASEGPWANRVILDVDPAESPEEVARAFSSGPPAGRQARSRPVKEKHARLAVHALVEHASLPWKERTRLWNTEFPQWLYAGGNYRRDALDTRNRLLRIHTLGGRGSSRTP